MPEFYQAEARIIEVALEPITGEFTVSDIKRANHSELFASERMRPTAGSDANCCLSRSMEAAVRERNGYQRIGAGGRPARRGEAALDEGNEGYHGRHQIASVAETAIMERYPWRGTSKTGVSRDGVQRI